MQILHCFADQGIECEALSAYGNVTRVGLDPVDNPYTDTLIEADARDVEFDQEFDLGIFHPPCQRWSSLTHIHGDPMDHPNLIPLARALAEEYCGEYIIENVVNAPLENPTVLDGKMFGLPISYKRAFETSYHIPDPPRDTGLGEYHLTDAVAGDWTGSVAEWKSIKGYSGEYDGDSIRREAIPRAYINYLVRPLL